MSSSPAASSPCAPSVCWSNAVVVEVLNERFPSVLSALIGQYAARQRLHWSDPPSGWRATVQVDDKDREKAGRVNPQGSGGKWIRSMESLHDMERSEGLPARWALALSRADPMSVVTMGVGLPSDLPGAFSCFAMVNTDCLVTVPVPSGAPAASESFKSYVDIKVIMKDRKTEGGPQWSNRSGAIFELSFDADSQRANGTFHVWPRGHPHLTIEVTGPLEFSPPGLFPMIAIDCDGQSVELIEPIDQ